MPTPTRLPGHPPRLVLAAVLAVAGGLRFWAIGAGVPYRIGVDEPFVVSTALGIMRTGDFNPHFFDYGGLAIYFHAAVGSAWFLLGSMEGRWSSLGEVWIGDMLPAARVATAMLGTLTVLVVYRIGLRLGAATAAIGAFVMAVLPQHVRESHYALTDTPLTLLTALTLLLSLRAVERRHLTAIVIAACAAGLTAAVRYNGGLALVMPLLATLALPAGRRLPAVAAAFAGAAAGFLAGAPYSVLDLPGFLNGFAHLAQSYVQGRPFSEAAMIYLKYMRNWFSWGAMAPPAAGYAALVLGGIGAVAIAWRRGMALSRTGSAVVLVFPLLVFAILSRQGSLQYGRYLLPITPMLALAIAAGMVVVYRVSAGSRWRQAGAIVLLATLLLMPAGQALSWVLEHRKPRTEELASAWVVAHAGQDIVVVEGAAILLPPSQRVSFVRRLVDATVDDYVAEGAAYLVSTAAETDRYFASPEAFAREIAAYQQIVARTEPVAVFFDTSHPGPRISIFRLPQ